MPEIRKKFNLEVMTTFFENFRQNPQILKSQISVSNFKSRVMVLVSNFYELHFFIADSWSMSQTESQTLEHQKWLAIHQHALRKRCLHMTNIGRSKTLCHHHSCIVIHKNTKYGYPYSSALHNRC